MKTLYVLSMVVQALSVSLHGAAKNSLDTDLGAIETMISSLEVVPLPPYNQFGQEIE